MLAIRMQRKGRKGHAQFRVIVQDSRFSPSSGRVVAYLGSYDPHTKTAILDSEKTAGYLENGAQPSDRVIHLLKKEGVKLPKWAKQADPKKREVRKPEKRRSTSPEPEAKPTEEAPDVEAKAEEVVDEPASTEEVVTETQAPKAAAENQES